MKLYYAPGACSLSPHIVARELGIDLALEKVDVKKKTFGSGRNFLEVNPKGYVPALEIRPGEVLTEGPAIVQYLADQKAGSTIIPASGIERYRQLEMLAYINSEVHKTFAALFAPSLPAEAREERIGYLKKRYAPVEEQLSGRDYLFGSHFTAADAYLFTITNWGNFVKVDLSEFPHLMAFQQRVAQRPAVQAALKAEGLVK